MSKTFRAGVSSSKPRVHFKTSLKSCVVVEIIGESFTVGRAPCALAIIKFLVTLSSYL